MNLTESRSARPSQDGGRAEYLGGGATPLKGGYHFVGIGGCGMSALALLLHAHGHPVSGSDLHPSAVTQALVARGIPVAIGHAATNVPPQAGAVVYSAAIRPDNPELGWARRHGLRAQKYASLLGELSLKLDTLAVAGTHGKSTTSAWLSYVLRQGGADPSFVIGADVPQLGGGSGVGSGRQLVVEACEYDRSFLNLAPRAAAVLNIEADHLDYYRDLDEIVAAFAGFAAQVRPGGTLVVNGDDPVALAATEGVAARRETFALRASADWQAGELAFAHGCGRFRLLHRGNDLGAVALQLAGRHNVANALAVAALATEAGTPPATLCAALGDFAGVTRRMTYRGRAGGVTVLDDYAHHPTEIRATLEAIAARYEPRRLWCVFQPHQHSRTRFLLDEFASSFAAADVVLLPDIYFVRDSEALRQTINAEMLARQINDHAGRAHYLGDFAAIVALLGGEVQPGDLVVTMGAGDVWKVADELIRRLQGHC